MFEELLNYYNEELSAIKKMAISFAERYPKIAGRLKIGRGEVEDPHVVRLIQAFSFLNARIRHKLDDEFPEINKAFLSVLYPHYLAPLPSFSIVQFKPRPGLTSSYEISKETKITSFSFQGDPCYFSTVYPVTLWPIEVEKTIFKGENISFKIASSYKSCLKLSLRCIQKEHKFADISPTSLRFFINDQLETSYLLYDLIFSKAVTIAITKSSQDPNPIFLDPSHIKPVGFCEEEGALPYSNRSSLAYRLLTEFFAYPKKFLFFDLDGIPTEALKSFDNSLEIHIFFTETVPRLEGKVLEDCFLLGCTPLINLFYQRSEPVSLKHTTSEIRIIPDARHYHTTEVHSLLRVSLLKSSIEQECLPLFGIKHMSNKNQEHKNQTQSFWHETRKFRLEQKEIAEKGATDVFISLTNENFDPWSAEESILKVDTLCTNANLPSSLPFGGKNLILQVEGGDIPITHIATLQPFSPSLHPCLNEGLRWKIISHLSLNHLSLTNDSEGVDALKDMLKLYQVKDTEILSIIEGISKLQTRKITARSQTSTGYLPCQGLEITLELDEKYYTGNVGTSQILFGAILEQFFAEYCNINSFTQLILKGKQKEGIIKKWPPRAGNKILL